MDPAVIIGIVSLIGAIHFSFAKNLIEKAKIERNLRDEAKTAAFRILIFIPVSDGMVGLMFAALATYLSLAIIKDVTFKYNQELFFTLSWILFGVLLVFSFLAVFLGTWSRVNKVVQYCQEKNGLKHSPWPVRIFLIVFFSVFYALVVILFAQSVDLLGFLQGLAVVLSTISFIGWIVCIALWTPLTSLGKFLE